MSKNNISTILEFEIEDHTIHEMLLQKIVELFAMVRGFSLIRVWSEKLKQQIKKDTKEQNTYVERFTMLHTRINTVLIL